MVYKKVEITKDGYEKILSKNPWIYNKEIKKIPKNIIPGEIVKIYFKNTFCGVGYINPKSKIVIRVLSYEDVEINENFLKEKIEKAFNKRKELLKITNAVRLIHAEADGLPGLVVDYYDGYLSLQINTFGMERLRDSILKSLIDIINPKGIIEKSDEKSREKEGLETEKKVIFGTIPERILINEYDAKFLVSLAESQKTGFYLDQRVNRKIVSSYVKEGFRVLDLFCNTGGFGIHCGKKDANFIKFVDISSSALSQVEENLQLNNIKNCEIVKDDVFDFLKKEKEKYDLIILDPPPFAKNRKEKQDALRGFKYLILNSLKILNQDGYLAIFSCSQNITLEDLINTTYESLKDTRTMAEFIQFFTQDKDHPYILNIPTSFYLKGIMIMERDPTNNKNQF